ncbi:MAG: hypothetical protein A2522_06520 [Gallionellales bacterium RIFOXYD12_FULL_53_10]|jgi:putative nucleotidyltransferase with HDIG domain|nr:MAG: hypothetical protein A2Z87_06365 [Gallionellales bacterium GWA2_54_124]OGS68892.1 MAG: hypothetical protein A2Z87_00025 [Gallionellales bacterium GWA2_54_124]OGT20190.1 MAG: hypothetical protein A2522_06520 [Gallionellales bacterium RIFOXYD12_FULL_53_10]OGT22823.1 MAG: hypothetical protein A3K00_04150 [Gallionellales bacterium RIFOXYD2_FULL_52_7]
MLKKISVDDVKLGMHIEEMCGGWMDHPFWKSSFEVKDSKILHMLHRSAVREVWINTRKGIDVAPEVNTASEDIENLKVEETLLLASKTQSHTENHQISLHDEIDRARIIHAKAKKEVISMFQNARMGRMLNLENVESLVDEINQSMLRNDSALLSLLRIKNKDDYTYLHSISVCALMLSLGRKLGLEGASLNEAGMAGLLHDIGKSLIPENILNKPSHLSDCEFEVMKEHPQLGWNILSQSSEISEITLDVCLHHHERLDGSGYPKQLSGDTISLFSRMAAICDVYDAITADRCYKKAWEPAIAIRKMAEWKDGNYDVLIFHAFIKTIGIYPVGSLVTLNSGRLGIVIEQTPKSLLTPRITVFYSTRSSEYIHPEIVDLSKSQDGIFNIESTSDWPFSTDFLQRMLEINPHPD